MSWLQGHNCDMCDSPAVMAFLDGGKRILTRLCEQHNAEASVTTKYEVWRGDMLENEDGESGEANVEYLVKLEGR